MWWRWCWMGSGRSLLLLMVWVSGRRVWGVGFVRLALVGVRSRVCRSRCAWGWCVCGGRTWSWEWCVGCRGSDGFLGAGVGTVFCGGRVVVWGVEGFLVTAACGVVGVSRWAFCGWSARGVAGFCHAELAEAEFVGAVSQVRADSGEVCGSLRVVARLCRQGRRVNHKRVERLVRFRGVCGIHKGRGHKGRGSRWRRFGGIEQASADLVRRDLCLGVPDRVWAGDVIGISAARSWLYVAVVFDVGSRRLIGYSMVADMAVSLVVDALDAVAAATGGFAVGAIFHSERGPQCLSGQHVSALARREMRCFVGRVGCCWDGSVVESFFSSLKRELVSLCRFETRD